MSNIKEFKYLGSTVQESGGCEREVKKRVQARWNGWRRVSGVIYEIEEMKVAEMKMLGFAMGVTRKDKIRNEYIRGTVKVERFEMKMKEGRLK